MRIILATLVLCLTPLMAQDKVTVFGSVGPSFLQNGSEPVKVNVSAGVGYKFLENTSVTARYNFAPDSVTARTKNGAHAGLFGLKQDFFKFEAGKETVKVFGTSEFGFTTFTGKFTPSTKFTYVAGVGVDVPVGKGFSIVPAFNWNKVIDGSGYPSLAVGIAKTF